MMAKIYSAARRAVRTGALPGGGATELLRLLECVRTSHVGLPSAALPTVTASGRVAYQHVIETPGEVAIGIFLLPPFATIPLHDHPQMSVLSRVLAGSLRVRSFDWAEAGGSASIVVGERRRAFLLDDDLVEGPVTRVLHPEKAGNVHAFAAGEDGCTILDVIAPPYDHVPGSRSCHYYVEEAEELGAATTPTPTAVWLRCIDEPDDFWVEGEPYRGEGVDV